MTAAILVSAVGILEIPKLPDIPGISRFAGDSFHSARWNNKVSLAGKRVAVIGGGASASVSLSSPSRHGLTVDLQHATCAPHLPRPQCTGNAILPLPDLDFASGKQFRFLSMLL